MISLSCAWVLKAFTKNPYTGHHKYSNALKTHAKSMQNLPTDKNALKPMRGRTPDSQKNDANRLKPMHRLAKTKKTAYAQTESEGEQPSIRGPSVKEALTLTHSHSFASPARTQRTTNETISRFGDSQVHTPPKPPISFPIWLEKGFHDIPLKLGQQT